MTCTVLFNNSSPSVVNPALATALSDKHTNKVQIRKSKGTIWSISTNANLHNFSKSRNKFVNMRAKPNRYIIHPENVMQWALLQECSVLHFVSRQRSGLRPSRFAAHLDSDSVNKATVPSVHVDRGKRVSLASRSPRLFQTMTY